MPQTHPITGETLHRWRLETSAGTKITWKPTAEAARASCEQKGWTVKSIKPAPDPLTDR